MSTIPIVASASDVPDAIRYAERKASSRWYVAKKAQSLGVGYLVPRAWGLTAATWNAQLHPRDRSGRFIEVGDMVDIFPTTGAEWPTGRGQVVGNASSSYEERSLVKIPQSATPIAIDSDLLEVAPISKASFKPRGKPIGEILGGREPTFVKVKDLQPGQVVYPVDAKPVVWDYTLHGMEDTETQPHEVVTGLTKQGNTSSVVLRNLVTGEELTRTWRTSYFYSTTNPGPAFVSADEPAPVDTATPEFVSPVTAQPRVPVPKA